MLIDHNTKATEFVKRETQVHQAQRQLENAYTRQEAIFAQEALRIALNKFSRVQKTQRAA